MDLTSIVSAVDKTEDISIASINIVWPIGGNEEYLEWPSFDDTYSNKIKQISPIEASILKKTKSISSERSSTVYTRKQELIGTY